MLIAGKKITVGAMTALAILALTPVASANDHLTVYQPAGGLWYAKPAVGAATVFGAAWGGFSGAQPFTGRINADATIDQGIYNPQTATWFVRNGNNGNAIVWNFAFGPTGATPLAEDFDGDGFDELVAYDSKTGNWFIRNVVSNSTPANGVNWGFTGCIPVPGDYNNDGLGDLAVYDSINFKWYVRNGINGAALVFGLSHGFSGGIPVAGDYNGDGSNDLAIFNPNNGNWFIIDTAGNPLQWNLNWGFAGVTPTPGDYNNDGTSDLAVYHGATGNWFIRNITFNQNWGSSAMLAVPLIAKGVPPHLPVKGADGAGGFLWKPRSDSNGNVTVLLSPAYIGQFNSFVIARDPSGVNVIAGLTYGGLSNPNRPTFRGGQPGANYGSNFYVVLFLKNGTRQPWFIPSGGSRVD